MNKNFILKDLLSDSKTAWIFKEIMLSIDYNDSKKLLNNDKFFDINIDINGNKINFETFCEHFDRLFDYNVKLEAENIVKEKTNELFNNMDNLMYEFTEAIRKTIL